MFFIINHLISKLVHLKKQNMSRLLTLFKKTFYYGVHNLIDKSI